MLPQRDFDSRRTAGGDIATHTEPSPSYRDSSNLRSWRMARFGFRFASVVEPASVGRAGRGFRSYARTSAIRGHIDPILQDWAKGALRPQRCACVLRRPVIYEHSRGKASRCTVSATFARDRFRSGRNSLASTLSFRKRKAAPTSIESGLIHKRLGRSHSIS